MALLLASGLAQAEVVKYCASLQRAFIVYGRKHSEHDLSKKIGT